MSYPSAADEATAITARIEELDLMLEALRQVNETLTLFLRPMLSGADSQPAGAKSQDN
jgi:hypothetical protein